MDAARVLTQFVQRVRQPGGDALQVGAEFAEFGWHRHLRRAQLQCQRDQALLGAVVQVTLDAASGLISSSDDARPRGDQLGLGLSVGERGRDQLGELC
jgi:hypothetical protein